MTQGLILRYIDVVLLLLLGFISLASFNMEELEPPITREMNSILYRPAPLNVVIPETGEIQVNQQVISETELLSLLDKHPNKLVVVLADAQAPANFVLGLARKIAEAGYEVSVMMHYKPNR